MPWNQSNLYFPGVGSFAPKSTGDYAIHISRDEKPIKGSPFHIKVGDKELAHASKVKVSGPTTKAKANEPNILELDCSDAGRTKKNHRRFDTLINEISVKHVARICYFIYL